MRALRTYKYHFRIWLTAISLLLCTSLNAQSDTLYHKFYAQYALSDSLQRNGDIIGAYQELLNYNRLYDSLLQVLVAEKHAALEEDINRRWDAQALQLQHIQQMADDNQHLQNAVDSVRARLSQLNIERMRYTARLQTDSLARMHRKAITAQEEQQAESENNLAQTRLSTYILLSTLLCLLLLLVLYYTWRLRRANRVLSKATRHTQELYRQAQAAEKMKTFFIQNLSHEIRTPLNAIVGFSDMLLMGQDMMDDEEKTLAGKMISDNGEQLVTLVSDILDVSNMNSGMMRLHIEEQQVNSILRYALSTVEGRQAAGVKLWMSSEVDDAFILRTDVTRVRQLLVNFLTNACKYTEQGEIHLHCALDEQEKTLTFSVTDTGSGIDKEKGEKVFERFEMLDSMKQGTGLGLNICRLIAQHLQGEVRWDSTYTQGARFLFIHPLHLMQDREGRIHLQQEKEGHTHRTTRAVQLAVTVFLLTSSMPLAAQDNPYGIPNEDYARYEELMTLRDDSRKLIRLTEEYAAHARSRGEHKSEIMLYTPLAKCAKIHLNERRPYLDFIKKKAREYNLMQYYYWAYSIEITSLLNYHWYQEAMRVCRVLYDEGKLHEDSYALALYYSNTAKFYFAEGLFRMSADYFNKAIDIIIKHVPSQNPAYCAMDYLSSLIYCAAPYEEIQQEVERLYGKARTEQTRANVETAGVLACYLYDHKEAFDRTFPTLAETYPQNLLNNCRLYPYARALYAARRGWKEEALQSIDELRHNALHNKMQLPLANIYFELGMYDQALEMLRHIAHKRIGLSNPESMVQGFFDIYHADMRIYEEESRQKEKIARLEAERLQLQKEALEDSIKGDRIRLWEDSMALIHTILENQVEQVKARQAHEEAVTQAEIVRIRHRRLVIVLRVIGVSVLVALFYTLLLSHKRRKVKESYKRTRQAMREAMESDRNKTRFIHMLSHEIRTPLNAIIGFSGCLTDSSQVLSEEEKAEAMQSIRYNTSLLSTTINNILELSRLEAGKTRINMASHEVFPICQEAVAACQGRKPGVEVNLENGLPEGYMHFFDTERLKSILEKIMDNALKFTDEGHVTLRLSLFNGADNIEKMRIVVEDTGRGISEEDSERVFEQFYKVDHFAVGTGLGLSIARLSAERMGGSLVLDTSYHDGARFILTL